jgi:DeoR family transcriptional regulator of aga operon
VRKNHVVADSTKFGHTSLALLCPLDEIDVLVTDNEIGSEWQTRLAESGVKVVTAEPADSKQLEKAS